MAAMRSGARVPTAALLSCAVLFGAGASWAAAPPEKKADPKALEGELVEIETSDGWKLSGSYLASKEQDQLTFLLLHEARGRKQNWYWLARRMARRGIGYLALDLRGHGLSQNPPEGQAASWRKFRITKNMNEWDNIRQDIAAGVAFLKERGVPEDAIALGGAEVGGSLALKYAALHPVMPMVFFLSPGMSYREVLTVNAMRAYRDRPILFVVAEDDRRSATETPILYEFAKRSAGEEYVTLKNTKRGHGTRMLYYNKGLIGEILDWIDNPIKVPAVDVSTESGAAEPNAAGAGASSPEQEDYDESGLPDDENLDKIVDGND